MELLDSHGWNVMLDWRVEYHSVNLWTDFCELRLQCGCGGLYKKYTTPSGSVTVGLVSLMSYLKGIV